MWRIKTIGTKNGDIVITIKEIHQKYRNKTLKKFSQIDEKTVESYIKAIKALSKKKVTVNTEACKDKIRYIKRYEITCNIDTMLHYTAILSEDRTKLVSIKYNLGNFGKLLLASKRMTSQFPVELLECSYKEITKIFIGLYISKILFINKKKKKSEKGITISALAILRNIVFYDTNGNNTSKTLLERLEEKEKQNYSLLKSFENSLIKVLELYKKHNYIKDYEVDKITGKNYKSKATKVKLVLK